MSKGAFKHYYLNTEHMTHLRCMYTGSMRAKVLLVYASCMHLIQDENIVFGYTEKIAEYSGLSKQVIPKIVKKLDNLNIIKISKHPIYFMSKCIHAPGVQVDSFGELKRISGLLYLLVLSNGKIKIGQTSNFKNRLKSHRKSYDIELIYLSKIKEDILNIENEIHLYLDPFRCKGELYNSFDYEALICKLNEKYNLSLQEYSK